MEAKTKTCQRCGGTGFVGLPIPHRGVPGLCMSCDGCGSRRWVCPTEAASRRVAELQKMQADCEKRGTECKTALAQSEHQRRRGAKSAAAQQLEFARRDWRTANEELTAILAGRAVDGFWEAGR
jgi:hypothetical protein